jgi:RNA polymerase sigma factor (sigma-70 family)
VRLGSGEVDRVTDDTVVDDLQRAAQGEQASWDRLVDRFGGLVWSVARSYRLSPEDAADVSQTTWLRLVEHLGRLREPERLSAWLVTTAKRECLRVIRSRSRERVLDLEGLARTGDDDPPLDARLLAAERSAVLMEALGRLGDACQRLLRVLMASPPPSYDLVSEALGMPIGSIGPTRARCLTQLRRQLAEFGITQAGGGSV